MQIQNTAVVRERREREEKDERGERGERERNAAVLVSLPLNEHRSKL